MSSCLISGNFGLFPFLAKVIICNSSVCTTVYKVGLPGDPSFTQITFPPPLTLCSLVPTFLSCLPSISLSVPHVPLPHRGLCFCPSLLSEAAPSLSQIQ